MSILIRLAVIALYLLLVSAHSAASDGTAERADHFKGLPADTLAEALTNLSEYNAVLASILAENQLGPRELHNVHELTYTLENALQRLMIELNGLADTLEEIHLASERNDAETVRRQGEQYLKVSRTVID